MSGQCSGPWHENVDLEAMNRCMNMLNIRSRRVAGFRVDVALRASAAIPLCTSEWT